jgi:F-type H+-transporting ATPase subunit delta
MVNRTLARRYAIAISELAREQNASERVTGDLQTIAKAIGDDGAVRAFFEAPVIGRPDKERVLTQAFGNLHPVALHSLLLLVRKRRETLLQAVVAEYLTLERAARGRELLTLTSARPLDRGEYAQIVSSLERTYGKKFEVTEVVDPAVIGGLRVMMGDRRIDDTISGRLEALTRELAQAT